MEEKIDRLVVELLDLIDSYAGVQQVIAKRSADIMYLLAREKFHVRGGSERLDVLLFDRRPHRATLKCIQEETTRNGLDFTELCIASKDDSSSVNIIQWFPVNEVQEDSEAQLDTFCLSHNLKEAKRLSENLTSLTLEAISIQTEMNQLLEKLSEFPSFNEQNVCHDIKSYPNQEKTERE